MQLLAQIEMPTANNRLQHFVLLLALATHPASPAVFKLWWREMNRFLFAITLR